MVRLTALLKSRNETKREEHVLSVDETPQAHGSGKVRSMFLQSEDISPIYGNLVSSETLSRVDTHEPPIASVPPGSTEKRRKPEMVSKVSVVREQPSGISEKGVGAGDAIGLPDVTEGADDYPSWIRRESVIADTVYIEMVDLLEDIYSAKDGERESRIGDLINLTGKLIEVCRRSNVILRKAVRLKKEQDLLTLHSLNTAILSIKIGIVRGFSPERLFSLAMSALLGDIGMTRVDAGILEKKEKLTPVEFDQITYHVRYSQEILSSEFASFPFLAPIAAQIHERENGGGYPLGLKGENIHEFAKIIGLSDVYIAMTSRKAHREDFSGYATLQQIISRRGIDFSPQIIKSLIDVISVFPLESLVKLNNGAIGRVIDISPVHPTRPKLLIVINSDGEHLKNPKFLDLEQEPLLYVETPDIEEGVVL